MYERMSAGAGQCGGLPEVSDSHDSRPEGWDEEAEAQAIMAELLAMGDLDHDSRDLGYWVADQYELLPDDGTDAERTARQFIEAWHAAHPRFSSRPRAGFRTPPERAGAGASGETRAEPQSWDEAVQRIAEGRSRSCDTNAAPEQETAPTQEPPSQIPPELESHVAASVLAPYLAEPGRAALLSLFPVLRDDGVIDVQGTWPDLPPQPTFDEHLRRAEFLLDHVEVLEAAISALSAVRNEAAWELSLSPVMARRRVAPADPEVGTWLSTQRVAAAEISKRLAISDATALGWIKSGAALATTVTGTGAALATGALTTGKAAAITSVIGQMSLDDAEAVERVILPSIHRRTPHQLREAAATAALELNPDAAAERAHVARQGRRVNRPQARADGMAVLSAYLPAMDAAHCWAAVNSAAKTLKSAGDPRTLAQLRADSLTAFLVTPPQSTPPSAPQLTPEASPHAERAPVTLAGAAPREPAPPSDAWLASPFEGFASQSGLVMADPFEDGEGSAAQTRSAGVSQRAAAEVAVVITMDSLLGESPTPALLPGHGPVTSSDVRELLQLASTRIRWLVTSADGSAPLAGQLAKLIGISPGTYQVPELLKLIVGFMRTTCANPWCPNPARDCDLDHVDPFADGGSSTPANLIPLCRWCHHLKTFALFRFEPDCYGSVHVSTQLGNQYVGPPPF